MPSHTRAILLACVALSLASLLGCAQHAGMPAGDGKPTIITTFYPLEEIARNVAGDTADVRAIVPAGSEPHDYEATPSDIVALHGAQAFVTVGVEFAAFEDTLASSTGGNVTVIPAGKGVALLDVAPRLGEDVAPAGTEKPETGKDPHIWLSPRNMEQMTRTVAQGLGERFPERKAEYDANAQRYVAQLDALDKEYAQGLHACNKSAVLVNHEAFAYLGRDYNFTQLAIAGLGPESEPTPGQIKLLVDAARGHGIKYVLYEDLVDPRIAQTIAQEVGAQALELNPIEGTSDPNATYLSLMRGNLKTLRTALECA